jgi:hypothetical protein
MRVADAQGDGAGVNVAVVDVPAVRAVGISAAGKGGHAGIGHAGIEARHMAQGKPLAAPPVPVNIRAAHVPAGLNPRTGGAAGGNLRHFWRGGTRAATFFASCSWKKIVAVIASTISSAVLRSASIGS